MEEEVLQKKKQHDFLASLINMKEDDISNDSSQNCNSTINNKSNNAGEVVGAIPGSSFAEDKKDTLLLQDCLGLVLLFKRARVADQNQRTPQVSAMFDCLPVTVFMSLSGLFSKPIEAMNEYFLVFPTLAQLSFVLFTAKYCISHPVLPPWYL